MRASLKMPFSRRPAMVRVRSPPSLAGLELTSYQFRKPAFLAGWSIVRRLLADAGKPDKPSLYISRACVYFWSTVPYLARDVKRVEDVDSSGADHAVDAVRYGCLRQRHQAWQVKIVGLY